MDKAALLELVADKKRPLSLESDGENRLRKFCTILDVSKEDKETYLVVTVLYDYEPEPTRAGHVSVASSIEKLLDNADSESPLKNWGILGKDQMELAEYLNEEVKAVTQQVTNKDYVAYKTGDVDDFLQRLLAS